MTDYTKMVETYKAFDLRKRFQYEVEKADYENRWPGAKVTIYDRDEDREVYSYHRNYSMMNTFEPFRWWHEEAGEWGFYALISPQYTDFQVLDLTKGEVVYDSSANSKDATWNFCSVSFRVPDIYDYMQEEALTPGESFSDEVMESFLNRRTFAFVQGCVWGDDWSWKVGAIDLKKIFAGEEVQVDQRFGYLVFNGKLSSFYDNEYFFDGDYRSLQLLTPLNFEMKEGEPAKSYLLNEHLPNFTTDPYGPKKE